MNEVPKDQTVAARKCAPAKSRHVGFVPLITFTCPHVCWSMVSLPLSTVPSSRRCIESLRPSVLVKLSCKLCRLLFFGECNASDAAFEGTTSFSEHGLDAAILLRQHIPARSMSIALHGFNRHVFQKALQSNPRRRAQDVGFAWALQRFESYSHVGRYK